MITLNTPLKDMGRSLRAARKRRFPNDTQADFSRRISVSRYTYQKMEQGNTSVTFGHYYQAAVLLGCAERFNTFFDQVQRGLFEEFAELHAE